MEKFLPSQVASQQFEQFHIYHRALEGRMDGGFRQEHRVKVTAKHLGSTIVHNVFPVAFLVRDDNFAYYSVYVYWNDAGVDDYESKGLKGSYRTDTFRMDFASQPGYLVIHGGEDVTVTIALP